MYILQAIIFLGICHTNSIAILLFGPAVVQYEAHHHASTWRCELLK